MAGNSATISVLAHALDIEKDRRENNELGEQTVSALFGVPSNVELIGDAIPADGPYGIRCKDDLDTCVVSGRLPDVLRCLIAGSLKAPANDQLHISATSKLEPSFHESNGDMKVRIAPQKLEGHPVHRWGHSFAVLNIMDRGYLYCFPGKLNSDKLDMAIFQMVLWTLLRGSPPGAPTDVVQEAVHSSGSSVPTGQPFSALLAKIFEEEWHTPLRLFSQQEKASLNPQKAYTALPARELDRLASALEDERVVGRILDLTLGADWEQERPGILYFITKQVHGYVEIFFKRAEVAGVDYANMDARVTNLPSTLQPILQGLFRKEAVFTCGMSVAVWGGRDFFMFDLEDNANARQEVPHATNTVGGSTEHLHCLQGSSMSVTLRPAFVEAFASAVTTPGASHVNIYHHLGCGRLGWNLHVRALPPPEEEQRQQLADMGCLQLATPYPELSLMTMTFYNGWPAHGPNETQILKKSDITSLKDDLQGYLRNGRQATVLERVKSKVLELVERVMTVENSASPDGNTLRLETGTVLNFAEEFEPEQSPKLYAVIETLVRKGIERHDSFDAHTNCVSYSTEAASALRRQFAEQWRNVLLEAIDADRDIDSTVLDKFVEALGILNYMYDPVADGKQNPVGRMALDAVPNYHLRAHAKYNGLPAMCPSLVEAIVSEGTLEDVESSVFARLAVLETAAPRGESGGGGSVFNSAMIGGVIRCLPPGVGAYPIASNKAEVRMLWDPIIRYLIPWRALQQLPIGKAVEFDKEFLNEERTRYRAHAVALHLSKERLYPRKRFRFPADPNLSRLGPAIALPEGFPCIFTDKEISEDMCDRLRAIAGAIASTDNKHSPLRCQPFQEEPGPGTCISTTLEENVQISSSDEVAVAVVSLSVQRPQVPNFIVEAIRHLVNNYLRWCTDRGLTRAQAWEIVTNHVAYSLQHPPAFRWYFHPSESMIVKPRHLSFYRMDTFEDRFERASVEDGDSELEIEGDDLVLLQLPGVVDVDTHQACWKAADELDAIANVFMLHPGSSKIQVIIRDVQI